MARSKDIREGARVVSAFVNPVARGDFEVIGWDPEGILQVRLTAQGAKKIGTSRGKVFLSAVGKYPASQ